MRTNAKAKDPVVKTHEGAKAVYREKAVDKLRRSVLCCLLWEDSFYEDGESIATRICSYIPQCSPEEAFSVAVEARSTGLRHAPLLVVREMMRYPEHKKLVAEAISIVCDRPDQLTELLSLYWKDRSGSSKKIPYCFLKGAQKAFGKWLEYDLAKYKQDDKKIKLRDVLRLVHPTPISEEQSEAFKKLSEGTLKRFDTWEDRLSSGEDKCKVFTELLTANKLGGLALIRNLRNMMFAGVDRDLIRSRIATMKTDRIEPFRLMKAMEHGEIFAPQLEERIFESCKKMTRIPGHTLILVDTSGSMSVKVSTKSDLNRSEAGFGLAVLLKEVCAESSIFGFNHELEPIPHLRGFALWQKGRKPDGCTDIAGCLNQAWAYIRARGVTKTNVIIITDMQGQTNAGSSLSKFGGKGFFLNVSSNEPSIAHGEWDEMTGWSEKTVEYIARRWSQD